jgi:hypothetical protein
MATVLDIAGLGFAVRKFSLCIKTLDGVFELVMRMEHGAFVELHVLTCDEAGAAVVEEALRLNRGPSVLLLGTLRPPLVRTILSPLTRDQNGLQANICVSTLKLRNIGNPSNASTTGTVELQEGRLEEVANMMKSNSSLEHLEVINWCPTSDYPQCSRDSPVVTQLQNRLKAGGNLRSFTFYGQELHTTKVQCRRYLKPDRGTTHACSSCSSTTTTPFEPCVFWKFHVEFASSCCSQGAWRGLQRSKRVHCSRYQPEYLRVFPQFHLGFSQVSDGYHTRNGHINPPSALLVAGTSECSNQFVLILRSLTTLLFMVLSSDECDRDHGMRRRFLGKSAANLAIDATRALEWSSWMVCSYCRVC